ncbi:MBL fold metallo-hydrolase [Pseudoalteromonas sp. Ld20]|uniref:MBL fold metallo-hydrolase n=1 Tax=Pseudoalteromonas sp. Ld20 TaxID=649165 RepID=UPI00386986BD
MLSSPFKLITTFKLLIVGLLISLAPFAYSAVTWQTISPNIQFLQQQPKLRFYDSNQVLIQGKECALMFDASGNFAAVEATIVKLKSTLTTPLCYLVASHFHDDHLLGMAILQHSYPNAKLIVHKQIAREFANFQRAFEDKLDSYEQSVELSYQRLAEQPASLQPQWRKKLELAKQRLLRWRKFNLQPNAMQVSDSLALNLGDYPITLHAHQAHTNGDLTLLAEQGTILLGGDIVDWLPYPGHGNLVEWAELLKQFSNNKQIKIILPGHGAPLKATDLSQPYRFLQQIIKHVSTNPNVELTTLQQSFPAEFAKDYQIDTAAYKAYPLFLQAGLKRAKQSK